MQSEVALTGSAAASRPLDVSITGKTFRGADGVAVHAIENIAFTAPAGSFTTLIGPSGCGKTTALRIVLGLDGDFDGTISRPDPSGRIGVVFQEPRLLPWRTVEQNIRLALPDELRGEKLDDLFDIVGLSEMRGRFPTELSLGLARRVALARAFAIRPSLLLLDEPFVSLDEMTATRLRQLLIEVWSARRTTALMVTHNLREAVQLSDRIVFLSGRPSTVRGTHELDRAREDRDPDWREAEVKRIDERFPGVL